ncbi:DUF4174 domain-containing protein [Roseovarius sp. A21]|uniref:DUF4174 domain-containing protein n=1 Tax=Roseovarius bejariae TaxID=2576383 RepID=A0A844CUA3_9RHOB|nr:DUF4174 domain-containing protein [Roseovarius bejariae]MRU14270.1 DUF4174 domain-containing protein [Roseovarius bejariae]
MKRILALVFVMFSPVVACAQDDSAPSQSVPPDIILPGETADLSEFLWIKRPLIVFADSPADPRYTLQMEYLTERLEDLDERDIVVLTDTDPSADSALRERLHPRGFMLVLIGKDGTIYLRKPLPWDVREISRVIDKMPMRQQEMRDRRGGS